MRNERSRPLVDELHDFLRERRTKLSGKSETAKAIDYSLERWEVFTRLIDDGRLCMTNNAAERELRATADGFTRPPFAHPINAHEMRDSFPLGRSGRLSRVLSSSSVFRRLDSETSIPPNLAFHL